MRLLIDVNLSPEWCKVLESHGHEVVYWSTVGANNAPDETILEYAATHNYVLFTNDLDFGTLLFHRKTKTPSVIQIRGGWLLPETAATYLLQALETCKTHLEHGALVVLTEDRLRVRVLPLE
jgi:predicted nuclease of predicted toxin-antitoxin system